MSPFPRPQPWRTKEHRTTWGYVFPVTTFPKFFSVSNYHRQRIHCIHQHVKPGTFLGTLFWASNAHVLVPTIL